MKIELILQIRLEIESLAQKKQSSLYVIFQLVYNNIEFQKLELSIKSAECKKNQPSGFEVSLFFGLFQPMEFWLFFSHFEWNTFH